MQQSGFMEVDALLALEPLRRINATRDDIIEVGCGEGSGRNKHFELKSDGKRVYTMYSQKTTRHWL